MAPSLSIALPPIHRITKREPLTIKKQPQLKPSRHHVRTTSAPSILPSFEKNNNNKLSMDILLDAIDLDQQMRQFFRTEVVKSKTRTFQPTSNLMARRRSKSAPGAPPSYHHQRAFSARWMVGQTAVTNANHASEIALQLVQQHIQAVTQKR